MLLPDLGDGSSHPCWSDIDGGTIGSSAVAGTSVVAIAGPLLLLLQETSSSRWACGLWSIAVAPVWAGYLPAGSGVGAAARFVSGGAEWRDAERLHAVDWPMS